MDSLPSVDEEDRQFIVSQVLEKSVGCFLWVRLVLEELRQVYTSAELFQLLRDVPSDMDELYSRILDSMSKATYGKCLANAILTSTVYSIRPLTTEELYHALQLDIKDGIDGIEKSIEACCGQLIYVDSASRVYMIHQTAIDFLLRANVSSEFAINKKSSHKRLLLTCLQYLYSNEMKPPTHRKLSVRNIINPWCAFVAYACGALNEHIGHVSSMEDEVFLQLANFLNSPNILLWIE